MFLTILVAVYPSIFEFRQWLKGVSTLMYSATHQLSVKEVLAMSEVVAPGRSLVGCGRLFEAFVILCANDELAEAVSRALQGRRMDLMLANQVRGNWLWIHKSVST